MSRGSSRCGQDPSRCYASEARDDWADEESDDERKACEQCGCTKPNPRCWECGPEEDEAGTNDHRDEYKEWIERQLIEDDER